MPRASHFSVTTAGAFVLGGVAATVLATVVAWGGYPRAKPPAAPASAAAPKALGSSDGALPSSLDSALPSPTGEYLLDVSDVTEASELVPQVAPQPSSLR